jgi:putative membrane protein
METRRMRAFQSLILALTGFFLLEKIWSGKILLYINQRYVFLVFLAAIGLIGLAQVVLQERKKIGLEESHPDEKGEPVSYANLIWLLLPLVLGILIPTRSLGTSSLPTRGIEVTSPFLLQGSTGATPLERPSGQRTVLDWIRSFHASSDPTVLSGEPADVIGFVYHDPRLPSSQFLLGRYTVACCIADATAIGISVRWEQAAILENNRWVRVQGKMGVGQLDGQSVPVIDAEQVLLISEPEQPYIFP